MGIVRTARFKKDFQALPAEIQSRLGKALELFLTDPRDPSLRAKKIEGAPGIWELRVSQNYRLTFQFAGGAHTLRRVGTHDVLRQP